MAGQELVVWVGSEPVVNKPQALVAKHSKAWCLKFWSLYQRSAWSLQEIHGTRDQFWTKILLPTRTKPGYDCAACFEHLSSKLPICTPNSRWFIIFQMTTVAIFGVSSWTNMNKKASGASHRPRCDHGAMLHSPWGPVQPARVEIWRNLTPGTIVEKHHLDENQSGEKVWVVLAAVYFRELSSVSSVGGVGLREVILLRSPLYKVCGISIIFPPQKSWSPHDVACRGSPLDALRWESGAIFHWNCCSER